jgi:predicted phage tail protein
VATTTTINLAWTNTAANATAVLVEQSPNNTTFTQIASVAGTATTYTATGLTQGSTYYFRVRAQNASGNSGYSNTASTVAGIPAAPSGVAAGDSEISPSTQVNVYWTDNSTNETGFLVFRSLDAVTFTQIATVGAGVTEYDDPGRTPNTYYYYYVESFNAAGASAPSNTDNTQTMP